MKKIMTCVCLFLSIIVSGCQCDLSHKHYYNDRGVCTCGDDIALQLNYFNEEYISSDHLISQENTYYYKFKAQGESEIEFHLESEEVIFDRIEIRADGMVQDTAIRKDNNDKIYKYNRVSFAKDRTYYLKVTYQGEGNIKLVLKKYS